MKHLPYYVILIALCFLVYANSLNNQFVSDDIFGIVNNPQLSQAWRYWTNPNSFLMSINYNLGGLNPWGYHLTNIILHSIMTLFVFYFLRLFFNLQASLLAAALFAVHPIHAEAVTWISGRGYLMIALFTLGTYFLYLKATSPDNKNKRTKLIYYLGCFLLFSYFVFYNPSVYFIFPFLLILSDIYYKKWRRNFKLWLPFFIILMLRIFFLRAAISSRVTQVAKDISAGQVTWTNPIFNLVYSLFSHLKLLLWPAKLTLYHEPALISQFHLRLGLIALTLLVFSLPYIYKKAKPLFFAIGLWVIFLGPTYSPVTIAWLVAERYAYFPSVALSMFCAYFYESYTEKAKNVRLRNFALGVFIFIISAYGARTVARNEDWKSPGRLWRQTLLVSYKSPRAHNNMGDAYAQEGNWQGAIREFKQAIELRPDYADAYHNLANTLHTTGRTDEAIPYYKQAISFNPELWQSYKNLGIIYYNKKEFAPGGDYLRRALEINPEDEQLKALLGQIEK